MVIDQILNGGQCGDNAVFIGDDARLERHIEVTAHENALARDIEIFYTFFAQITHTVSTLSLQPGSMPIFVSILTDFAILCKGYIKNFSTPSGSGF